MVRQNLEGEKNFFFNSTELIILDPLKVHIDDGEKTAFNLAKIGAKLAVIPGGLTKVI